MSSDGTPSCWIYCATQMVGTGVRSATRSLSDTDGGHLTCFLRKPHFIFAARNATRNIAQPSSFRMTPRKSLPNSRRARVYSFARFERGIDAELEDVTFARGINGKPYERGLCGRFHADQSLNLNLGRFDAPMSSGCQSQWPAAAGL